MQKSNFNIVDLSQNIESLEILDWENFRGQWVDEYSVTWIIHLDTSVIDEDTEDEEEYYVARANSERGSYLSTGHTPEEAVQSLIYEMF